MGPKIPTTQTFIPYVSFLGLGCTKIAMRSKWTTCSDIRHQTERSREQFFENFEVFSSHEIVGFRGKKGPETFTRTG